MPKIIPTLQAQLLFKKLCDKGINAQLEYWDGFKHVDIAIPDARLYVEVDGMNHFDNPEQIIRDFKREHYSDKDGFNTFFVTNQILEDKDLLEKVADALVTVIRKRQP